MFIDNILPANDLRPFVRKYTIVDVDFSGVDVLPCKAYPPHPQDCLQFYPKDTEVTTIGGIAHAGKKAVITGQFTGVSTRHIGRNFLVLQVVFQPGALYRITGLSPVELANVYMDAELIFGNGLRLVNEQLASAGNHAGMIPVIENYLRVLARSPKKKQHPLDEIASLMLASDDKTIGWFAKEACLCQRQFDFTFRERIGVNPKLFARLVRFIAAYKARNRFPDKDWLTIALHAGYYDYQHLVRDYKDFTGETPARFFERELGAPERYFGNMEI